MESREQLDAACRASAVGTWTFIVILVPFLISLGRLSHAQDLTALQIEHAGGAHVGTGIARQPGSASAAKSDTHYNRALALAQAGRLDEARVELLAGHVLHPRDKRFLAELGGVAFKQKNYAEAASWLHRALRIDPLDAYANDFLGSVYFLQGNLEAALKYWNRVNKPQIATVSTSPELKINPVLLDRAFAFSPAGLLRTEDLLLSQKRLDGLGVFATYKFRLAAREDGQFDLNLHAQERDGFGANRWAALLSACRGVFYRTLSPEYFNVSGSATNITSLVRWDAQKRRAALSYSSPLNQNPKYQYHFALDARNENWVIFPPLNGSAPAAAALNLERQAVSGGVSSFDKSRWSWSMDGELSHRQYRNVFAGAALAPSVLLAGYQLKQIARLNYELLRIPERRFFAKTSVSAETATIRADPANTFEKLQGALLARWLPQARTDDYAIQQQLRTGRTFGQVPFDELFMLGLERDNDLYMRAHIGTRDGRKGSAPLGRDYFLSNWEIDKNVYSNGLFGVKLSPFLDTGKITDASPGLGSEKWLWDTGLQLKFKILGVGLKFTYGKDLRSGGNSFYLSAQP
jgi:tetratricopeptide (TPR) repeat protein